MWLAAHPAVWSGFSAADVHRVEGIVIYFGGLVLLYHLTPTILPRMAVPLAAYYAVTLAIPLANGAAQASGAFARHAVMVLAVPPVLSLLGCAVRASLRRQ
jgi:hypothetical protein